MQSPVFDNFIDQSPISVMARAMMERVMNPKQLDEWFMRTAESQYQKDLLFSSVFDIMSQVVCGIRPSVNAAYRAAGDQISVSLTSVYNKLNGIETNTSRELVRYAAGQVVPIIEELGGTQAPLLRGYNVKLLDGNCIEASEHRIKELRELAAGALPGKSLVVFDPVLRIPVDVFPCEDGHAQERSLLGAVLQTIQKKDLWIADRNFCTIMFTTGIHDAEGFFIIREHGNYPWQSLGKEKAVGRVEGGRVYEQPILVTDENGKEYRFRRIRVCLENETRDGDLEIAIITDLPKKDANAKTIARLYRKRWKIETAFQHLAEYMNSEINALGYPPAALFGFCVALISYMILSVIMAALGSVHGADKIANEVSGYYLADELSGTYRGMMIAIADQNWIVFRQMPLHEFIALLKQLAANANLSAFRKSPRGKKKPPQKRISNKKHPHVSTAKILAKRKK